MTKPSSPVLLVQGNMPQLTDFDRDYLRLTLHIDKHIPGYVDAYIGPEAIRREVDGEDKVEPAVLLDHVSHLQATIPAADPARRDYLTATLRAVAGTLRLLNGEKLDYLEEVSILYDIQPTLVDEAHFEEAHRTLETLLPGSGTLAERVEARRRHYELRPEQILPLLGMARRAARERTATLVDLVDGEDISIRLTKNQPWGAYNWYLGQAQSLIEFNTDVPIPALSLLSIFAHEGYPGHHTEHQLKEYNLYRERGYGERAIFLLHSPAAVIAEGIATTAIEIVFPDDSWHEWNKEVMLQAAGIETEETAGEMARIVEAQRALRYVTGNASILYHTGQLSEKETIGYIEQYALANRQRAEKSFQFISNPLFRSYVFSYTQGYDLIETAANGNKRELFRRLLTGQTLPSQLREIGD